MEEAPENGKESLHSAHANGMNECLLLSLLPLCPCDKICRADLNTNSKQLHTNYNYIKPNPINLGTLISNDISMEKEIQSHILAGNRTDFAAISLFRSRLLSRATKIILYKTLIRPEVSYGAEAWTLTKKEEQAVLTF